MCRFSAVSCCAVLLLLWGQPAVFAQEISSESHGIDRWSVGTNAVEWLLTVPNLHISYDLSSSRYNHLVGTMAVKYNWDTWQNTDSYYVFNVFELRPELRRYFRAPSFEKTRKLNPWPAYYLGAYSAYTLYSLKPGAIGRQGYAVGLGVSAGYEIPLYTYRRGAVDLDLGVSAGLLYHRDEAYVLTDENPYYHQPDPAVRQRFPLLPMVTELRASFSWRHKPVNRKYLEENPMIKRYKDEVRVIDQDYPAYTVEEFWKSRSKEEQALYGSSEPLYRAAYFQYVGEWEASRLAEIGNDDFYDEPTQRRLRAHLHYRTWQLRQGYKKAAAEMRRERKAAERERKAAAREQRRAERARRRAEKAQEEEL